MRAGSKNTIICRIESFWIRKIDAYGYDCMYSESTGLRYYFSNLIFVMVNMRISYIFPSAILATFAKPVTIDSKNYTDDPR